MLVEQDIGVLLPDAQYLMLRSQTTVEAFGKGAELENTGHGITSIG